MNNIWFWIGIWIVAIALFQFIKILVKNKKYHSKENPTSNEKRENDYENKKFSATMNFLSVLPGVIPVFMAIYPFVSISIFGGDTETTQYSKPTTFFVEATERSTSIEIISETDEPTISESIEEILPTTETKSEDTKNIDVKSVVDQSKKLIGEFSENSSIYKYILNATLDGKYGLVCSIDNEEKSYIIQLNDENDNEIETYQVSDKNVTYTPQLTKDLTYIIYVIADEGYPHYEIQVKYPKSNDFN